MPCMDIQYQLSSPFLVSSHSVLPSLSTSFCSKTQTPSSRFPSTQDNPALTAAFATTSASCAQKSFKPLPTAPAPLASCRISHSVGLDSFLSPTSNPGFKITQ